MSKSKSKKGRAAVFVGGPVTGLKLDDVRGQRVVFPEDVVPTAEAKWPPAAGHTAQPYPMEHVYDLTTTLRGLADGTEVLAYRYRGLWPKPTPEEERAP